MYAEVSHSSFKSAEKFFRKKKTEDFHTFPSFVTLSESPERLEQLGITIQTIELPNSHISETDSEFTENGIDCQSEMVHRVNTINLK